MARKTTTAPQPTIADEVRDFLKRFIYLPDEHAYDVLALYVVHTQAFDYAKVTPYIYLNSAERGSGKTTTLEILKALCRNAEMASNLTSATLYRVVESSRPTFLVDEVDAIWSGAKNEDLRGILNSGYEHNGSVLRAFGNPNDEDGGVKRFSTFCPKVLAGIDNGQMPDTITDRSIMVTLKRANATQMEAIEDFYIEDEEDIIAALIEKMQAWVGANADKLMMSKDNRPARLSELGPRQNQIAAPILHVAALIGDGWYQRAKDALVFLLASDEMKLSPQATALLQIRDWFHRNPEADRISSAVAQEVTNVYGRQLGVWLNAYGIKNFTGMFDGKNAKGYRKDAFTDAFERYLPAAE